MTATPSPAGQPSRRHLLQVFGSGVVGAVVLSACGQSEQADRGVEFHGGYPYQAPPKGHFNLVEGVTESILGYPAIYSDLIVAPAAMYLWAEKKYEGILAESWELDKTAKTFSITLKEGLKWSDGKPVTSTDMISTWWALRIMRNVAWDYVSKVEADGEQTVVFTMDQPSTVVERYVLRQSILSDATYGSWAKRAQELIEGRDSLDSPEGKKLNEEFQQFRPDDVVANGPFKFDVDSVTSAQLTLVKNKQGYAADKVDFDRVVVYNGEVPDITPVIMDDEVDYATHGFPVATEKQFRSKGLRILRPPVYSGPALYFNMDRFPEFNDVRIRRAFAYALDRPKNGTVALGESGKGVKFMAGFSDLLIPDWLSEENQGKLERYENDPKTAEQLLTEAGWKKNGPNWMKPDGKPASYELIFPAEFADWSASGQNVASQLKAFGINVSTRGVNHIQQPIDVDKGNFELAIQQWGASNHPHPHFSFVTDLFTHNIPQAKNAGGKGMGFELTQTSDKLGKVDLEQIVLDAGEGLDEAEQKKNVTAAAIAFNEFVPIIPLFERYGNNAAYEGQRVQKFPGDDDPVLKNAPYSDNFVVLWMLQGKLKAVRE